MFFKSLFDRVVALFGLFLLWPILLIVAILIRLKMPGGPVIFTQRRVGQHGGFLLCLSSVRCVSGIQVALSL